MKSSVLLLSALALMGSSPRIARASGTVQVNTPGDCRFYIESAVDEVPGHYNVIHVFVRTRIGFDSGVKTVAVQGTQYWNDDEGSQQSQADDFDLAQVPGCGDLWEGNLYVSGDNDVGDYFNPRVEVTFVVTSVEGTTYTLNSSGGSPFTFDPNMYTNLGNVMKAKGLAPQSQFSSVNALEVHGNFPYLDPNNCAPVDGPGAPQYR